LAAYEGVENLPAGWVKRRSGIIVPGEHNRVRLAQVIAGIILSAVAFSGPVTSAIADWSRAGADLVTLLRTLFDDAGGGCEDPETPASTRGYPTSGASQPAWCSDDCSNLSRHREIG
jgi:hypothetical protein